MYVVYTKFNKKAWLKSYTDINAELRKKCKKWFWKKNFKLVNNAVLEKTMENVTIHRDIKIAIRDIRDNNQSKKDFQNQTIIQQKCFHIIY